MLVTHVARTDATLLPTSLVADASAAHKQLCTINVLVDALEAEVAEAKKVRHTLVAVVGIATEAAVVAAAWPR